jgi:hypothetical protein
MMSPSLSGQVQVLLNDNVKVMTRDITLTIKAKFQSTVDVVRRFELILLTLLLFMHRVVKLLEKQHIKDTGPNLPFCVAKTL